jgi:RNA polymerase sigma factor (sigma-70 family)
MNPDDAELLRRFAQDGSQAAFKALVRARIDLVYSAALRLLDGDAHGAADVTQEVFVDLARKAATLATHPSLVGWLYQSTRFAAGRVRRSQQRRVMRETKLAIMNEVFAADGAEEATWQEVRPVLDEAMGALEEDDRQAVLQRFFEQWPFAAIAVELGISENAAQKRVNRALDELRTALQRRGVSSTLAVLGGVLTTQTVAGAPVGLAASVAESALLAVPGGAGVAVGVGTKLLALLKLKTLLSGLAVAVVVGGGGVVCYHAVGPARAAEERVSAAPPAASGTGAGGAAQPAMAAPGREVTSVAPTRRLDAATTAALASVGDAPLIAVADRLTIAVMGEPDLNAADRRVDANGNINLALVGDVHVAGLTAAEAAKALEAAHRAARVVRDPQVSVTVDTSKSPEASISGMVKNPGKYTVLTGASLTLKELIEKAGGLTEAANPAKVRVSRAGAAGVRKIHQINLMAAESGASGSSGAGFVIEAGDIVYVPEKII